MNTPEERAAYIISQSAAAHIKALGMQAENMQREALGQSMAYDEAAFDNLIQEHGLDHNSVVSVLRGLNLQ